MYLKDFEAQAGLRWDVVPMSDYSFPRHLHNNHGIQHSDMEVKFDDEDIFETKIQEDITCLTPFS